MKICRREILRNPGQNIDIVAGVFDEPLLDYRQCAGRELSKVPICCAVSIHHRLAVKEKLTIQGDLYDENLLLMRRGWSHYVDLLRDDVWRNDNWKPVHPLLKILSVDWEYIIPFGLLHSPNPFEKDIRFLNAVTVVMEL